jgi:hypothetical protein
MIIKPPKNPVTIAINGFLIDNYLRDFFEKNLPAYSFQITSGYRDEQKNAEVGGVQDSTHLYNLGRDYVITRAGVVLNDSQMEKLFKEFILPQWEGFTKYYRRSGGASTGHIHGNLDRDLNNYTKFAGIAAIGAAVAFGIKKFIKKRGE